jgi:hypothetical protein
LQLLKKLANLPALHGKFGVSFYWKFCDTESFVRKFFSAMSFISRHSAGIEKNPTVQVPHVAQLSSYMKFAACPKAKRRARQICGERSGAHIASIVRCGSKERVYLMVLSFLFLRHG